MKARGETGSRAVRSRNSNPTLKLTSTFSPFSQSPLTDTEGDQTARRAGAGSRVGDREMKVPGYLLKQNENKQARDVISLHQPAANKHISNQTASGILQIEVTVPAFKGLLV